MIRHLAILAGIFLAYSGAYAGEVKVFPAKDMDVTKYETYQWMPIRISTREGIKENDDVVAPEIKKAVDQQLQSKGYKEVAEGGQMHVMSMGLAEASNQLEGLLIGWGWATGWGWAPATTSVVSRVNREGTIAIGLIDAQSKKPVWAGYATEGLDLDNIPKTVNKATGKLFKKLPARK